MKSSFYFTFPELIKTDTKLKNIPSIIEHISNLIRLARVLNRIRIVCDFPIIVNSAFRSPEVNSVVGGVSNSYHLDGLAADITTSPLNFPRLCDCCKSFYDLKLLKECIIKSNYIHLAI